MEHRILAIVLVAVLGQAAVAQKAAEPVLRERDIDRKGELLMQARKGANAIDALLMIERERHALTAAAFMGQYFRSAKYEGDRTIRVIQAMWQRSDIASVTPVMIAQRNNAPKIAADLAESRRADDRVLAGLIPATVGYLIDLQNVISTNRLTSRIESLGDPEGDPDEQLTEEQIEKKRDQLNRRLDRVDHRKTKDAKAYVDLVTKLLEDADDAVKATGLIAAGYLAMTDVKEAALAIDGRTPDVQAAQLFYRGTIGEDLPADAIAAVANHRYRVDRKYTQLSPALASYDLRDTPQVYLARALALAGDASHLQTLYALLDAPDLRVQVAAAKAIQAIGSNEAIEPLLAKLKTQPPWPVRLTVISALGAIPDKRSVNPLIAQFETEDGRLRRDVFYALSSISVGEHGWRFDQYKAWWNENGDTFEVDPAKTRAWRENNRVQDMDVPAHAVFYNVEIASNRVVFVLDTSLSMKGDQIISLRETMKEFFLTLPDHFRFNIVDFGGAVRLMNPRGLISPAEANVAYSRIESADLTLGTRTYDALEMAAGVPEIDTIIYLSDGAPVAGQFDGWEEINLVMKLYNRFRPLAIDTVYFATPGAANPEQTSAAKNMREMADMHFGRLGIPH